MRARAVDRTAARDGHTDRDVRPTTGRHIGAASQVFVAALLAIGLLLLRSLTGPLDVPLAFALVLVSVLAVRMAATALAGSMPARSIILVMAFVFFGVAPIPQLLSREFPWGGSYSDATLAVALLLTLFSICVFDLSYAVARRRFGAGNSDHVAAGELLNWRLSWRVVLLAAVSVGALWVSGAWGAFLDSREAVARAFLDIAGAYDAFQSTGGGRASGAIHLAVITVPAAFAAIFLVGTGRVTNPLRLVGIAALLAYNLVVNGPIGSSRHWVASVWIGIAGAGARPGSRLARVLPWALLLGLVLVYPVADYFRLSQRPEQFGTVSFASGDFDAFQQVASAVVLVDERGVEPGRVAGTLVGFAVPREIWPGKPENTGVLIGTLMGYPYQNVSAPLWAEGYLDSGWLGAGALAAALGVLCWFLDRQWASGRLRPFVIFIAMYLTLVVRGPLLPAMGFIVIAGASIALCLWAPAARPRPAVARQ